MSTLENWRRAVLTGLAISASLWTAPAMSQQKTFKVVMHSDLKVLDPVWSGAYIMRNHGYMIYDTLFAIDEKFQVKPQMVEAGTSATRPDRTSSCAKGSQWHDGQPVTAEDCVASLKRWRRAIDGPEARAFLKDYQVIDPRTFQIVLKEKFGPLIKRSASPASSCPS